MVAVVAVVVLVCEVDEDSLGDLPDVELVSRVVQVDDFVVLLELEESFPNCDNPPKTNSPPINANSAPKIQCPLICEVDYFDWTRGNLG